MNRYIQEQGFNQAATADEIDLRELFAVIWQGKRLIIAITIVFAIGSVIFALMQADIYKSESLLAPASEQQGGMGGLADKFGGLASLAGINLSDGGEVDKTQMAIAIMESRKFASDFIQKHDILPDLMAAEQWNRVDNTIIYNSNIYHESRKKWLREVKPPFKAKPSMQEAYKEFKKILVINSEVDTGMVTVSIEHLSPVIAQRWLTWLVEDINQVMKDRDVNEANRSIQFLTKQVAQTHVADIRSVLYKLIEEQAKTIMFAEVREEYAFKTIDPGLISEEKASLKRGIVVLLGTFLGFMLSLPMALIYAKRN